MSANPVAITGIAPICAVGIGRDDLSEGLDDGRDGRRALQRVPGEFPHIPLAGECLDFAVEDYLESEKTYLDRASELLLAACAMAIEDAQLSGEDVRSDACGLSVGTAFGCLDSLMNVTARVQAKGVRFASPMIFTHAFMNSPASLSAIEYGTSGPGSVFCTGDTSSAMAIQYAFDLVRHGRARVVLAGGVEALSAPLLGALNRKDPRVPAEGCCMMALETLDSARQRGAAVLAELVEVGVSRGGGAPQPEALWGHAFGAEFALRIAAEIVHMAPGETRRVEISDESGRSAEALLRG